MTESLTVEIDAHVAVVTLNRPDKHNALNLDMFEALIDAGKSLAGNATVRSVVLRGAGENFCAGIDTSIFASPGIGAVGSTTRVRIAA